MIDEPNPIQDAINTLQAPEQAIAVSSLLAKYFGAEENNLFTYPDYLRLTQLKQEITHPLLLKWLNRLSNDFENAMTHSLTLIEKAPLQQIHTWEEALYDLSQDPKSLIEKLMDACHDLYWDLHNPLTFSIDIRNVAFFQKGDKSAALKLFELLIPTIENYGFGHHYQKNYTEATWHHKIHYLQSRRVSSPKKEIVILGSGLAGLSRLLVAWMKGAPVTLFEKEPLPLTTVNLYKLKLFPLLTYFGLVEWLLSRKKIFPIVSPNICVHIQDLYEGLYALIQELTASACIAQGYELDTIQEGTIRLKGKSAKELHPTILVDATGSAAVVAEALGNKAVTLSEPSLLVLAVFKGIAHVPSEQEPVTRAYKQFALATPECRCELILPSQEVQHRLFQFKKTGESDLLQKELLQIAKEAAEDDPDIDHQLPLPDPFCVQSYSITLSQRQAGMLSGSLFIQESGDAIAIAHPLAAIGATTALKGAIIFSATLDMSYPLQEQLDAFLFASSIQTRYLLNKSFAV